MDVYKRPFRNHYPGGGGMLFNLQENMAAHSKYWLSVGPSPRICKVCVKMCLKKTFYVCSMALFRTFIFLNYFIIGIWRNVCALPWIHPSDEC